MSADIERLKTDAAYWDEVAPEGASHWCKLHKKWIYNPDWYDHCCIPRPTKPAEEWNGEGLPPVGCECEVRNNEGGWHACKVVAHHRGRVVLFLKGWTLGSDYDALPASEFRPLKTPEQRQREEISEVIAEAATLRAGTMLEDWQYDHIAAAILSRYNLEPK